MNTTHKQYLLDQWFNSVRSTSAVWGVSDPRSPTHWVSVNGAHGVNTSINGVSRWRSWGWIWNSDPVKQQPLNERDWKQHMPFINQFFSRMSKQIDATRQLDGREKLSTSQEWVKKISSSLSSPGLMINMSRDQMFWLWDGKVGEEGQYQIEQSVLGGEQRESQSSSSGSGRYISRPYGAYGLVGSNSYRK